jgi:cytosine/adenosine deaminase-related metal-dependent hydrolase
MLGRVALALLATGAALASCREGSVNDDSHPLPYTSGAGTGTGGPGGAGATTTSATNATSATGATASTGVTTGGSGGGMCGGDEPVIESMASVTKVLLKGTVLTPSGPIAGQVLISGNSIACVDVDCSAQASGATVVDTHGVISPGLINAHDHILYDIFNEDDWTPMQAYSNHNQWTNEARYGAMGDAKRYIDGESSALDYGCEMDKYSEMKELVSGTTSIQASPGGASKACYGSLARTLGISYNDLPDDRMQTAVAVPTVTTTADNVCTNETNGTTTAYVVHVAEGVDNTAHNEFTKLFTVTTVDGCLFNSHTTIIHGVALNDADFAQMGAAQMSLVWSPKSNVFLYGSNTDISKTANITLALAHGVNIAIAPDWSIGGSQNMLDEMRYANYVDDNHFGDVLTSEDIWKMATVNAARALGVTQYVGTLEVGKRADIAVFTGDTNAPFDAILAATPREVTMVFVDGRLLYGDSTVQDLSPANATCEALDVCCRSKVACIAETGGNPTDKLGQTFAEIQQTLSDQLTSYDAMNLTQWKFAPIAPLVKCN